jgi:hypothetical protein
MRADSRIPRQANSPAYWREAGARRCRMATASARKGPLCELILRIACLHSSNHLPSV